MTERPTFKRSLETQTLVELLRQFDEGDEELMPYEVLTDAIGIPIQEKGYAALQSARRILLNDGIVFGTVQSKGLKQLTDAERVQLGDSGLSRIRRIAAKTKRELHSVQEWDKLSAEDKVLHNSRLAVLGAVSAFSRRSNVTRISEKIEPGQKALPVAKTIELFKS